MSPQHDRDGGGTLQAVPSGTGASFLYGDALTSLWNSDDGVALMAAKKKKKAPARKPARKPTRKPVRRPAKPKKKPRPTRSGPGCMTTDPTCGGTHTH
jgi:hypothetical protein